MRNALGSGGDQTVRTVMDEALEGAAREATHFGPYRVIRLLGEGGFGKVYLALQTEPIRRHVALKILKKGVGDAGQMLARFELERQAVARMDHPSICRIYDAGESESGVPYFAMEAVDGRPINHYCAEVRPPLHEILTLFREICSAVDHAHQRGVIHRDLKPSNVLITERDGKPHPVVIDFGIAKAIEPLLGGDTILTQSFQIIGTPIYMSPEQAESGGHDADVRSDVYALGAMLYELLCGSPPITQEQLRDLGVVAIMHHICTVDTPPPSNRIAGVSTHGLRSSDGDAVPPVPSRKLRGDLDWITMRALAKDRERRYQSARELAEELDRYLNGMPVLAGPPSLLYRVRKFVRRHPAGVAAAGVAIILAAGWLVEREYTAAAEAQRAAQRLLGADLAAAPLIIADISPSLPRIKSDLRTVATDATASIQQQINAALALASADQDAIRLLCEFLLSEDSSSPNAEQAAVLQAGIAQSPDSVPLEIAERARQISQDPNSGHNRRLRAAALLASTLPDGTIWEQLAPDLARIASGSGMSRAIRWAPVLLPVAHHLIPPVREIFSAEPDTPAGAGASLLLARFLAGDAEALAKLAAGASPQQFIPLSEALVACGAEAIPAARAILADQIPVAEGALQTELDAAAERRSRAAMLLLQCGEGSEVWPLLTLPESGDPRLRTFVIHGLSEYGIPPEVPAKRLTHARDPSELAALVLALGRYSRGELGARLLSSTLVDIHRIAVSEPDAGVHGAAEWTLRSWEELPRPKDGSGEEMENGHSPSWLFDERLGVEFATFEGPIRFVMGSPATEPGRADSETQHEVEIPRGFAIATKVLTYGEIQRWLPGEFDEAMRTGEQIPREMPGRNVSVFMARRLCNRASEEAGIPSEQWCYTDEDEPEPKVDATSMLGYRFPTEAEWEYACRGGSSTPRSFGYSLELLPYYACISKYGGGMRPPGSKMPNDFGLFDMLGNVQNFIEAEGMPDPGDNSTNSKSPRPIIYTLELPGRASGAPSRLPLRGQCDFESETSFRSTRRTIVPTPASWRIPTVGIRLARTLPLEGESTHQ